MKPLFAFLLIVTFASFAKHDDSGNKKIKPMPCNYVFGNGYGLDNSEYFFLTFTDLETNQMRYGYVTVGTDPSAANQEIGISFCSRYKIDVVASTGGTPVSIGLKAHLLNGGTTTIDCEESVCCGDEIRFSFDNIRFSDYSALNFEFFIKYGNCT